MGSSNPRPFSLLSCVFGIFATNLAWAWFQERLNTPYGSEKFTGTIALNFCQAVAAALVGALQFWRERRHLGLSGLLKQAQPLLVASFAVSVCHTIASPLGYSALRFLPYPLAVLASSMKLVPILLAGLVVRRKFPSSTEMACVAIITLGVGLYSFFKGSGGHGHHGGASHHHSAAPMEASNSDWSLAIGLALILANLSLEGLTNALQDKLFHGRHGGQGAASTAPSPSLSFTPSALMMAMNVWSVLLLAAFLMADGAAKQAVHYYAGYSNSYDGVGGDKQAPSAPQWVVLYIVDFIRRHPSLLLHLLGFSLLGAMAQVVIFETLHSFGSVATAAVTVSRKFFTVLLSVAFFKHRLNLAQWTGVALVFVGLALQLRDKQKAGHGRQQAPEAAIESEGKSAATPVVSPIRSSASAVAASFSLSAVTPNIVGGGYDEQAPSRPLLSSRAAAGLRARTKPARARGSRSPSPRLQRPQSKSRRGTRDRTAPLNNKPKSKAS